MSYRNSGLVTIDVDSSALENRIDEIESKLDQEQTIEDKVTEAIEGLNIGDLISEKLDETDYITRSDAEDVFREMAHSEGEDLIRSVISDDGYITSDDVDEKIRDADFPDEDRVQDMIDEAIGNANNEDVQALKADLADLARRLDVAMQRIDEMRSSNETAVTFFGLIQKAFDLLMQGRRGS